MRTTPQGAEPAVEIFPANSAAHVEMIRGLFQEYAQSLGFSLDFQGFGRELAELPGMYAPPRGRLLLASVDAESAGCVGLRPLEQAICEMKRLYVRPQFRGLSLGRRLAERIIAEGREIGYRTMRLDTVAGTMDPSIELYRRLGFVEIEPYRNNPIAGALYLECKL